MAKSLPEGSKVNGNSMAIVQVKSGLALAKKSETRRLVEARLLADFRTASRTVLEEEKAADEGLNNKNRLTEHEAYDKEVAEKLVKNTGFAHVAARYIATHREEVITAMRNLFPAEPGKFFQDRQVCHGVMNHVFQQVAGEVKFSLAQPVDLANLRDSDNRALKDFLISLGVFDDHSKPGLNGYYLESGGYDSFFHLLDENGQIKDTIKGTEAYSGGPAKVFRQLIAKHLLAGKETITVAELLSGIKNTFKPTQSFAYDADLLKKQSYEHFCYNFGARFFDTITGKLNDPKTENKLKERRALDNEPEIQEFVSRLISLLSGIPFKEKKEKVAVDRNILPFMDQLEEFPRLRQALELLMVRMGIKSGIHKVLDETTADTTHNDNTFLLRLDAKLFDGAVAKKLAEYRDADTLWTFREMAHAVAPGTFPINAGEASRPSLRKGYNQTAIPEDLLHFYRVLFHLESFNEMGAIFASSNVPAQATNGKTLQEWVKIQTGVRLKDMARAVEMSLQIPHFHPEGLEESAEALGMLMQQSQLDSILEQTGQVDEAVERGKEAVLEVE